MESTFDDLRRLVPDLTPQARPAEDLHEDAQAVARTRHVRHSLLGGCVGLFGFAAAMLAIRADWLNDRQMLLAGVAALAMLVLGAVGLLAASSTLGAAQARMRMRLHRLDLQRRQAALDLAQEAEQAQRSGAVAAVAEKAVAALDTAMAVVLRNPHPALLTRLHAVTLNAQQVIVQMRRPVAEFDAAVGIPEGALYVDGKLIGSLEGVVRLEQAISELDSETRRAAPRGTPS